MESVKPPGVEDCPSAVIHCPYQNVVDSCAEGTVVVVGGKVVLVVVVVVIVVIDCSLINLSRLRRRRRAILSFLFLSELMREFEYTLLP